jgi:hypothetical protein
MMFCFRFQNAFVCIYLAYSFSSLADLAPEVVNIAGNAHRVAELLEALKRPEKGQWDADSSGDDQFVAKRAAKGDEVEDRGWSMKLNPNVEMLLTKS